MLTLDSSDDNKGVSSEGPSIPSNPKEGPSIVRRSKEPIPKELLEWYGYDTVEDYLPVVKKPIPKVIFKSPIPIKGCVLGLANVETWDNNMKKSRMRTPERCEDKLKGKRKIKNKEIEAEEESPRGIMWLKGRVNKDEEFTDDEIRSVGDKLEGTLNLDDGIDAMTVVFGKEKGGYARGVGSGVTYKRYFHFPQSRQATDEKIKLLQTQLDNERRERQQKDVLVKKLSTEMTEKDVTPIRAYEVDITQSSVVIRDKDARIQKKSNGLVTLEKELVKTVRPKKMPKSRRNGSKDSQSQGNVSPTQELPTI
nr:hypothetical protein [Tanacetum cinerariifolium]